VRLHFDPRLFLLALTALAFWLGWLIVQPFAGVLFMAAVVAVVLSPVKGWMARRLGRREGFAPALLTLLVLLTVLGPIAAIGTVVVGQAVDGVKWLVAVLDQQGVEAVAGRLPAQVRPIAERALSHLPHGLKELEAMLARAFQGGATMSQLGGILQATGTVLSQLGLFFVALYFLLADGSRLVDWLKRMMPLPAGKAATLFGYLRTVTNSVVISTLATSGVQATLALVGYLIAGVPSAIFFAVVTFFTSFIPAVGTLLVWLPLALLGIASGRTVAGVFLILWGVLVVGMADNFVKPILIRRGVAFPIGAVFFALLGGLAAFGPVGLVAGPLTLAFTVAIVNAWHDL
jgi:predicted PurR-regulated permease PerM